jgi:hypothetical protein
MVHSAPTCTVAGPTRTINYQVHRHQPSDAVHARLSSLEFWKKAISFFRLIPWNSSTSQEGNPTKSIVVNDLIKRVKKKEVRKQGVAPQSCLLDDRTRICLLHSIL